MKTTHNSAKDDHLNSLRYNKMDQMTIVERLFHYHDQLGLAKEVIKLLEQQRNIYRQAIEQCTCAKNSDSGLLMKLDDQLQSIYRQCNFDFPASKDTTQITSTISTSSPVTSSQVLGIDMKTFFSDQNAWNLHPKFDDSLSRKRILRCSVAKCRFKSFTEKSLIRHQLLHLKEQFISLIKPYGFDFSYDCQIIYCPENTLCSDKTVLADQTSCWFPFCNYRFPILPSNDSKSTIQDNIHIYIDHLQEHVSAYILHPCYDCLLVFDSKEKLKHHFQTQTMCTDYTRKYASNTQTLYDKSNNADSLLDIENIKPKQNKLFRFRCKLCENQNIYSDFVLFSLHVHFQHTGTNPNVLMEIIEDDPETSACHSDPDSIYCKLCKQIIFSNDDKHHNIDETALLKLKQDHAKMLHNFDEEFLSIDLIYSDSNNYPIKENLMSGQATSLDPNLNNIGMEVFIENTNNHNDDDVLAEDFTKTNANNDDGGDQPSNFAPVFYDDHNYNIDKNFPPLIYDDHNYDIERRPESNKNLSPSPSPLPSLNQPSDDHDDYTKNISNVLSDVVHDHSMIVADDAAQYGITFEDPQSLSNNGKNSDSQNEIGVKSLHSEKYSPEILISVVGNTKNVGEKITSKTESLKSSKSNSDKLSSFHEDAVCFPKLKDDNRNDIKRLMSLYIYECALCFYSFRSENELSTHNYLVHKIASFQCSYCDYVTQDTEKYYLHQKKHQTSESINLTEENVQSTIKQSVKIQPNLTFVCSICSERFETQAKLNAHVKGTHAKFRCELCQMVLANVRILNSHKISFHRDSLKKCDQCTYKTFDEGNFRKHQRKHQEYKCCPFDDCGDLFPTEEKLEAHVNKFHKMIKPHNCDECQQKFLTQNILDKHMFVEHKRPSYKCDKCDFKTNIRYRYRSHLKVHSNIKPFKCPERGCFKSFRYSYNLESHCKHKHTQLKSIECAWENCSEMFKTKPQMQKHFRLNHPSTTVKPTMVSLSAKTDSSNNKSSADNHIQYYVIGNINVGNGAKSTNQPKSTTTATNISARSNSRSLMIKPALLRPTSSIDSSSTSILTTTIIPVDDDHDDDDNNEEEDRKRK